MEATARRARRSSKRVAAVRLVDVLAVGRLEGHPTAAVAYWRLTDAGRRRLVQLRSAWSPNETSRPGNREPKLETT